MKIATLLAFEVKSLTKSANVVTVKWLNYILSKTLPKPHARNDKY